MNCIDSITSGNIFCLLLCVSLSAMHYTSPNFFVHVIFKCIRIFTQNIDNIYCPSENPCKQGIYKNTIFCADTDGKLRMTLVNTEERIRQNILFVNKAEQKSLVPARQAQQTHQRRTLFICNLWIPFCLSFNSQKGPSLSRLSGYP